MRKIYVVVAIIIGLYSCTFDKDHLDSSNESIEAAAKNSSTNVKLIRAWTSNSSSPVGQRYVRRFVVKVKNLAFQKQVAIYHSTTSDEWVDIPLTFQQQIGNNEEIWAGEVAPDTEIYSNEFVVKYSVNGKTYWDNNNGSNYNISANIGAYLAPEVEVSVDTYFTRFAGTYFAINVDARRDYGSPGEVEAVYTTDSWATTQRVSLSYQRYFRVGYSNYILSPNQFDIDKWETSISFDSSVQNIEYAVVYRVGDQEYWDNNYGKNYKISKRF